MQFKAAVLLALSAGSLAAAADVFTSNYTNNTMPTESECPVVIGNGVVGSGVTYATPVAGSGSGSGNSYSTGTNSASGKGAPTGIATAAAPGRANGKVAAGLAGATMLAALLALA